MEGGGKGQEYMKGNGDECLFYCHFVCEEESPSPCIPPPSFLGKLRRTSSRRGRRGEHKRANCEWEENDKNAKKFQERKCAKIK
jgi:hypothetical protein